MSVDEREVNARLFFALVPPRALQQALGEVARDVASRVHGRPVQPANIHMTIAFIGAWPLARLDVLMNVGAQLVAPAMDIVLDSIGRFRRAGIAWMGASTPPPELSLLASSLATKLAAVNVSLAERRFHPHLTLARKCRESQPIASAGPYAWHVDAVTLMRSETRAEGPRY
ncbi:MAG TPA: RNA 2',3'-cyclic phosphodiesterase, partial [Rhodanobacteraceae bacterium]